MNKKAYKALEYYKIIDLLTDKASSPMGKDLCRKLTPSTDIEEIRSMQLQTHERTGAAFRLQSSGKYRPCQSLFQK